MALIRCPECKKEVSGKAKACPFCGYPFGSSDEIKKAFQQVEIASVNIQPKDPAKMKKIYFGIIAVIILAIAIIAIILVNSKVNYKNKFNSYIDNLNYVMTITLEGGSKAENLSNLTAKVWHNAIYKESDSETNKYTFKNYSWVTDLNIALSNLYSDSNTMQTISSIDAYQKLVEAKMKEFQNPPIGLEKCYETVTKLYNAYTGLTDLAINPTGSYISFTTSKTEIINNFLELFKELKTQIPDKK
jgi:hypothetical protein